MALLIGGEMADGVFEVGVGKQGVAAGGVEAGVAEEFGDDDDVDARAQEVGRQGVPQDVGGKGEGGVGALIGPKVPRPRSGQVRSGVGQDTTETGNQ